MKQNLKEVFGKYHKRINTDAGLTPSAVLLPLYYKEEQIYILFTQRSNLVLHHKGQICFPGGSYKYGDTGLLQTALREAEEEIGLKAEDVEILGELDDISTTSSGYAISPFIALIPHPYQFKVNLQEITQMFSIPLSKLMDDTILKYGHTGSVEQCQISSYYQYRGHIIWGVTARILSQFLELLKPESGAYI
jgi:8-oxo-dGTP pyrophosphatase MutT (NUDIX family)